MSLVDKLDGVHLGDLLYLDGQRAPVVGFVQNYNVETVTLGTELPYELLSGNRQKMIYSMGRAPTTLFGTPSKKYHLKHFDSYEVLTPKKE